MAGYMRKMTLVKIVLFLSLSCIFGHSKTIRSRIYTTENGTKELLFGNYSKADQRDIKFLLKNLNEMNIATDVVTQAPAVTENSQKNDLKESILMQHWNSLTEVGWKNYNKPIQKTYLNNARILRLAPEFKLGENTDKKAEREEGRREERVKDRINTISVETIERKPLPDNEKPPTIMFDLCQTIIDLCQVVQPGLNKEQFVGCLTLKNKTLLGIVEKKLALKEKISCLEEESTPELSSVSSITKPFEISKEEEESSRTFLQPRKLLQKVLLSLLVILVIKYLVTIPFVALIVLLNALWLGLLSIGAVLFAKFKSHNYFLQKLSNRRLTHIPGGEVFKVGRSLTTPEIFWSPVRVPLIQMGIRRHL